MPSSATQVAFVILVAIAGVFAPQIVMVVLLAFIYLRLENLARS